MMWIHPILQFVCLLFSLYVLRFGYARFESLHRGVKRPFAWKRHATLGLLVLLTWLAGLALGGSMAYLSWNLLLITGWHGYMALIMLPLLLFGLVSGYILDKYKKKRLALPLAHGLNNAVLVLLAVVQLITGLHVVRVFLLP